jgi:hypothetical protein
MEYLCHKWPRICSTDCIHKTKDRVTRIPLKSEGELRCSGRVSSSCSTSGTRRVNLVTNPVISHEWGKDQEVFAISGTYSWSFITQIFHSGENLSSPPVFSWDWCYSIFSFMCMFCRSLLVLLYFFFLPLCCLFFFDIRILITISGTYSWSFITQIFHSGQPSNGGNRKTFEVMTST